MRLIITWTVGDIMDFAQIPAALQFQPGLSTNAILQIVLFLKKKFSDQEFPSTFQRLTKGADSGVKRNEIQYYE